MTKLTAIFITFILIMVIASILVGIVFNPLAAMITACGIFITFAIGSLIVQK